MSKKTSSKKLSKKPEPKATCSLVCPKCGTYWARMQFQYGAILNPKDIEILYGAKKRFARGETLACTSCEYQYNNYDVMIAIAEGKTTLKPGEKVPMPKEDPELDQDGAEIPDGHGVMHPGAKYEVHPGGELRALPDEEIA